MNTYENHAGYKVRSANDNIASKISSDRFLGNYDKTYASSYLCTVCWTDKCNPKHTWVAHCLDAFCCCERCGPITIFLLPRKTVIHD